jgi:hypothetical protein
MHATVLQHSRYRKYSLQVAIQGELHHPNVVTMYGVTFHVPYVYIVMELCRASLLGVMALGIDLIFPIHISCQSVSTYCRDGYALA